MAHAKSFVFRLYIHTGNAAFDHARYSETARILRGIADALATGEQGDFSDHVRLFDLNGNGVGLARFEEEI